MGTELETPVWPAIEDDEAEAVLARFPAAGRIEGLRWHSPRPFSAATLVDTTRGSFLLKRHDRHVRSVSGLAQEHAFAAHLAAAGVSVPEVMLAEDGATAIAVGEGTYELHRRAAGADLYRDRPSWTPFLLPGHAHAAGVALARLNQASHGFDAPARTVQPLVASFTILPATDPLAAAEAYVAARPALAAFLADRPWRRQLASLFAASVSGLAPRLAAHRPLWTHNDWHPSNLLWAPDGTVETVFDFGLADRTCAVHDLATAIERTAIAWLELGKNAAIADPEAALSLIAGYATIRPLDPAEIETMLRLLPLVHLEFALSEVAYFAGVLGDHVAATQAWDQYAIGHAEWFLSASGQDFLARIALGARG
ncbi:phosphotransferase [Sphingomonas sp. 4RDLI-65]|uniref:phosphotransferase enzyme family protein n=1 Tax=Sphingomonas sp. 4RDLI-65 TaxID=3111641 RepID=UPI003C1BAC80